jgi:GT2 family glycosyltransferase
MAVRKSAFTKVGGFNSELNLGEDADLSQRLGKVGKVFLDKNFLVSTSGRRYRKGLLAAAYAYIPNMASRTFLKKQKVHNKLSTVRQEARSPWSFVSPIFTLVMASILFFHSSVSAKAGRIFTHNGQRMVLAANQIVHHHHLHFKISTSGLTTKVHGI